MFGWFNKLKQAWLGTTYTLDLNLVEDFRNRIDEIHKGIQEVRQDLANDKMLLEKELKKKEAIIRVMIENVPDMLWFKDAQGKYVYANKAIRDGLLFSDNPIGKTDIQLAAEAKKRFGDKNHTFGEVCGNSDQDVLENKYVSKSYVEKGNVKGEMLHLEVKKSIIEHDGEIIGVVGVGRDITENRKALIESGAKDIYEKNEFLNKDE